MACAQEAIRARLEDAYIPDPNSGCWLWTRSTRHGYGALTVGNKSRSAHRVSYEAHVGPIPEGLHIDHLCRVRCCVNPAHMEPVTLAENTRRGMGGQRARESRLARTHCKFGHPFAGDNLLIDRFSGARVCKTCRLERKRKYNARIPKRGRNLEGLKLGGKASGEAKRARTTHCPQGHPYSGDNLGLSRQGWRVCRQCKNIKQQQRYQAQKRNNIR